MANKKRLIDANALKEQIAKEIHTYWTNGSGGYCLAEDVIPDIDNAPTVDAVEVVRCKDCRKCRIYDDVITRQKQYECRLWHGATREVSADSFCDAGERREGE